jgi:hypothetical protein
MDDVSILISCCYILSDGVGGADMQDGRGSKRKGGGQTGETARGHKKQRGAKEGAGGGSGSGSGSGDNGGGEWDSVTMDSGSISGTFPSNP